MYNGDTLMDSNYVLSTINKLENIFQEDTLKANKLSPTIKVLSYFYVSPPNIKRNMNLYQQCTKQTQENSP